MKGIPASTMTAIEALLAPHGGIAALPRPVAPQWLRQGIAAKHLGVCKPTIRTMIAAGVLKAKHISKKLVLVDVNSIEPDSK